MGTKLSPKDDALFEAVDEVLHYIWDPIGVRDCPQARDEYHSYVPQVFGLLRGGATSESISSYLSRVATETMGLSGNTTHDLKVAIILIDWKEAVDEKFA
jgi:hypothetical protein